MDLPAICAALAARHLSAVTPPTGAKPIALATHLPPPQISNFPAVLVLPSGGTLSYTANDRIGTVDIDAHVYFSRAEADQARVAAALSAWIGPLLGATEGAIQLGMGPVVAECLPQSWQIQMLPYAGEEYPGVTVRYRVTVRDRTDIRP